MNRVSTKNNKHSKSTLGQLSMTEEKSITTVDAFIRQLGADERRIPLLAYHSVDQGRSGGESFTGQDIDRFTDAAAHRFIDLGLPPVVRVWDRIPILQSSKALTLQIDKHTVVAVFALSNLDYLISLLGLGRLGYASLLISPKLSAKACVDLLEETQCEFLIFPPCTQAACDRIQQMKQMKQIPLLAREDYDMPSNQPPFDRPIDDGLQEASRKIFILHSSGSTGHPKLSHYTNQKFLMCLTHPLGHMTAFSSLPCYHTHGLAAPFMNWNKRKIIYLWDGTVPQTHETVATALELSHPEFVVTVPYVLKLLAEKQRGIDLLKACKMVSFSGSGCPDELGDMLVSQGIHLGSAFGSTECGMLFSSLNRPQGDPTWNYLRPSPHVVPYLYMKPVEENIHECVILNGFPNKLVSNSDDPPNSFYSSDLFTPHPTILGAWKFFGRLDDRVTLTNGEKVLPLPIEGRIRQDQLVRDAVVFGVGRPIPGALIFRSDSAADLADKEFIDLIWPAVKDANSRAEAFSQISREMIRPIPAMTECPSTDKGSIKRAQVYRDFCSEIDAAYEDLENRHDGQLELDAPGIEDFIMTTFHDRFNIRLPSADTGFFAAGVDSLEAIQMRGIIQKTMKLGSHKLDTMVVFNCGNAAKLAQYLHALQRGGSVEKEDEIKIMSDMIKTYSVFDKHIPGSAPSSSTEKVLQILTGATGGLGAHILAQLLERDNVSEIYCLVRTLPSEAPVARLVESLRQRGLKIPNSFDVKVVALSCDFSRQDLGIDPLMLTIMKNEVSLIIHSAWSVNFTLGIGSFEEHHIKGLYHLVKFSLSVQTAKPARFFFCSSISTALASPDSVTTIPEEPITSLSYASNMGYARSKLVAEQVVLNAEMSAGARSRVLRIGQIVGDTRLGIWNDSDAIPMMIRSALRLKVLPEMRDDRDLCSWIPVDTVAAAILDLSGVSDPGIPTQRGGEDVAMVYNLVNPDTFSWNFDLLPRLQNAGLIFERISFAAWVERLRDIVDQEEGEEEGVKYPPALLHHPYLKLVDFWSRSLVTAEKEPKRGGGGGGGGGGKSFETMRAREDSLALRNCPQIIMGGFIELFLGVWLEKWRM